ncbi:MAG: dynamin family protein [Ilumatobacteraceae bacterium]
MSSATTPAAAAPATSPAPAAGADAGVVDTVTAIAKWLAEHDRADLAQRAAVAAARVRRPSTIVCVVGEFKQGKSSLVNALLGRPACPVDDDLATSAITLVRHGAQPQAMVRRRADDQVITEAWHWTTCGRGCVSPATRATKRGVERLEIVSDSPVLAQGLVLVDTPGMGGLGAGHAAATLGFLPFADGLVFVSDASTELSAPEVEFLRRAVELCPIVLFALTKIDLYPAWQRIAELDRTHLVRAGLDIPIVPISSALRSAALERKDRELNDLSRLPELVKRLGDDVIGPAKRGAAARAAAESRQLIEQVRAGLGAERAGLADPAKAAELLATLTDAKRRLEHLRGPGAKWPQLVGDRVTDLSAAVNHRFRGGTRAISKSMDERIEVLTRGDQWDDIARELQRAVADEVTRAFVALERGRIEIRAQVIDLVDDEHLSLADPARSASALDVEALWNGKALDPAERLGKRVFSTSVTTVRGAQGGIYMFGMLGTFLPTAAGVLLASNPVLLGVGAVFGSMGLMDDRKRKVQMRRQAARAQLRGFLDDVQFEMGNQITNLVKEIQRELRDDVGDRLAELQRTYTDTIARAQADGGRSVTERQQRLAQIDGQLTELERLDTALGAALGTAAATTVGAS